MNAMSLKMQARLWYWQRMSATVLACCVLVHIAVIVYAVHQGLSAAAILGRTHGNWFFGAFYTLFVIACAIHVPIGLLRIAEEWLQWRGKSAVAASVAISALLAFMGLRAVYGVVA
ncbi:succinate dehydrogenase [Paraburkholderia phymatum]|uniref:succinate dehydrogenase n=1 Tax=Paraburkholderia phymatum TaxID=148447 RepID=UPI0031719E6A